MTHEMRRATWSGLDGLPVVRPVRRWDEKPVDPAVEPGSGAALPQLARTLMASDDTDE
jgi:hypothetical protein